ncbi:MAG: hypothetical protein LBB98_08645 [Treponema sp.]|nr:hypothetical protein [Treponema sp.]
MAARKAAKVLKMEYPNELYRRFDSYSATIFFNAYGYACVQVDSDVSISDADRLSPRKIPPYSLFDNLLMKVQKATCLYWPYKRTLNDLNTKHKEALGFHILCEDEVRMKIDESNP